MFFSNKKRSFTLSATFCSFIIFCSTCNVKSIDAKTTKSKSSGSGTMVPKCESPSRNIFLKLFGEQLVSLGDILCVLDEVLEISLANYTELNSQVVSKQMSIPDNTKFSVVFTDIPVKASFLVVQTHAHIHNISLSGLGESKTLMGTNVGFVHVVTALQMPVFYISNAHDVNVTVLVAAVAYSSNMPMPGGCNMEFVTKIAPYLQIQTSQSLITVESQPALFKKCTEPYFITYEYYHLYQQEADFTENSYFRAISAMISPVDVKLNARLVTASPLTTTMRRFFSAYRGTGSVYALVATLYGTNLSAAYIPAHTYACSMLDLNNPCDMPPFWWNVSAVILTVFGVLLLLYGHYYFKLVLFLAGFGISTLAAYVLFTKEDSESFQTPNVWLLIGCGLLFGRFWVFVWNQFGKPSLSIFLSSLALSLIVFAIALYSPYGDFIPLQSNINYTLILTCVTFLCLILFSVAPQFMNILSCALIGSYLVIFALDYFFATNLKYIFINIVRRFTVDNFNMATIDPPYQNLDLTLSIVWGVLAVVGIISQKFLLRDKPTFPGQGSSYEHYRDGERAALLEGNASTAHRYYSQGVSTDQHSLMA